MTEPPAKTEPKSYKKTLNLPKTPFAMKANLVQNEPASQKRWKKMDLYKRIREARSGATPYIFHDGPPYANGSIHLGHLLNKVLKDLVVRTKTMAGFDTPYIPGWDCHGLPIEHKVVQEQQAKKTEDGKAGGADGSDPPDPDAARMATRRACRKYAQKYIKLQSAQMQRLSTLADYDNPYLTMNPPFEASVLEVFADLVSKNLVYRDLKPVHWSIENQTALADAELEYHDREDTSIFVFFEIENPQNLPESLMARPGEPLSLMIWTTTPWTLPANLAVAVSVHAEYGLYRWELEDRNGLTLVAMQLADHVLGKGDSTYDLLGICTGAELEEAGVRYLHPFVDRVCPMVTADYVAMFDEKDKPVGTGLVHTAPGHGVEDWQTGLKHGLDIYCPVQADGTFDSTVPDWLQGVDVWKANDLVVEHLRESGHLFFDHQFTHSYPHDWRGKSPTIYRATDQWFIAVDKPFALGGKDSSMRDRALAVTASDITFYPGWGRKRMRGMLESRPDWCISRQRAWGLPIPAFYGPAANQNLLTEDCVRAVAAKIGEFGSDIWFKASAADLLADYDPAADPNAPDWLTDGQVTKDQLIKGNDIFDVWFESGSSWNACMRRRGLAHDDEADSVTDLYLEGSDQHRGWFQLSLLTSLGMMGKSPFGSVLTHGFMVDKDGKKMSKSDGNALEVEELLKHFGADICRWWVSSLNTDNDIKVDQKFFEDAAREYLKVRNTLRFIMGNLGDFDFKTHKTRFEDEDAASIDAWATDQLIKLSDVVLGAYEGFEFRVAHKAMFDFCNDTMSSVYLAAVKDRLYCDKVDSPRRRRTQSTLYRIATTLIRLVAPIMPHTADEAWKALDGQADDESVHLLRFGDIDCMRQIPIDDQWSAVMALRAKAQLALEEKLPRKEGDDKDRKINTLDVAIKVKVDDETAALLGRFDSTDLADLLGVSRFEVATGGTPGAETDFYVLDLRDEARCDRSWKRDGTVKQRADGGMLCQRCADAVGTE